MHTWIPRAAVGALVIARHGVYQLLENRLVTRLLALAQRPRHDAVLSGWRLPTTWLTSESSERDCVRVLKVRRGRTGVLRRTQASRGPGGFD